MAVPAKDDIFCVEFLILSLQLMPFKSVLTPHHSIPPPILAILVGRLPQVSTTIQDVAEEAAAAAVAATAAAAGKKDKANTDTGKLPFLFPWCTRLAI